VSKSLTFARDSLFWRNKGRRKPFELRQIPVLAQTLHLPPEKVA
jgi:hypothetical protein